MIPFMLPLVWQVPSSGSEAPPQTHLSVRLLPTAVPALQLPPRDQAHARSGRELRPQLPASARPLAGRGEEVLLPPVAHEQVEAETQACVGQRRVGAHAPFAPLPRERVGQQLSVLRPPLPESEAVAIPLRVPAARVL